MVSPTRVDSLRTGERQTLLAVDLNNAMCGVDYIDRAQFPRWLMSQLEPLSVVRWPVAFVDVREIDDELAAGLSTHGFRLEHCPRRKIRRVGAQKDIVDASAVEYIHQLMELCPSLTTLALFSADTDFIPMLSTWRRRGKEIVVLAGSGLSGPMQDIAHRIFSFRPSPVDLQPRAAVTQFAELIKSAGSPRDFELISSKPVRDVRDLVVSFFKQVVLPVRRLGRERCEFSRAFLRHGLLEQVGWARLRGPDVDTILKALQGRALLSSLNIREREVWRPAMSHPFIRYVEMAPSASRMATVI